MGRYSQTIILVLKLLVRKELGSPRRLVVPIVILSIVFIFSSVNMALIEVNRTINVSSRENIILETRIDNTRTILLCEDTSLYPLHAHNKTVTVNVGGKLNLSCRGGSDVIVCRMECTRRFIDTIIDNLKGKVVYAGRIPTLLNTIASSYASVFNNLYYIVVIMFVISIGGISYDFSGNMRHMLRKLSYWSSLNISMLLISIIISSYIVALSLSASVLILYSVSLMLSVLLSSPYIRPLPNTAFIIMLFLISWITIMVGLKLGARRYQEY